MMYDKKKRFMHPGDTDPMWSLDLTHRGVLPTTNECDHSLVPQFAKQKQRSPTKMSFWSFSLSMEVCLLEVEPWVGSTLCDPSNVGAEHSTDRHPEAIEAPKPNRRSRTRRLCSIWYRRPNRKQYSLKEIVPAAAPVEQKVEQKFKKWASEHIQLNLYDLIFIIRLAHTTWFSQSSKWSQICPSRYGFSQWDHY